MIAALRLALVLVLALASVTLQVARGQAAGVSEVVICAGYGVATVTLDARGNPTGPVHPCPDCLAHAVGVLPGGAEPAAPAGLARGLACPPLPSPAAQAAPRPAARGPPAA
jgi:hypothetical protein